MNKKLLLINDLAGYGKVALSAMIPVLSHMKYAVFLRQLCPIHLIMVNLIFWIPQSI